MPCRPNPFCLLLVLAGQAAAQAAVRAEGRAVGQHPVQHHRQLARQRHLRLLHAGAPGNAQRPALQPDPFTGASG